MYNNLPVIFPYNPVSAFWQKIAGTLKGLGENVPKRAFYRCVGRVKRTNRTISGGSHFYLESYRRRKKEQKLGEGPCDSGCGQKW